MRDVLAEAARIDAARVGRVLLLFGTSPAGALGPGSYHHEILVGLGASPAITRGAPFMTLDKEDLLHLAPEAIILIQPRWPGTPEGARDPEALRGRLRKLAALDLPALRTGRVALIDDPMALVPGTNLVEVAREMEEILRGWSADIAADDGMSPPPVHGAAD
jgi:ABC-type Fe3+-hydroxamate transport system substrate-binding protein